MPGAGGNLLAIFHVIACRTCARWRCWRLRQAQAFFGLAALLLPLGLGYFALMAQRQNADAQPDYAGIARYLPLEARLMANDPSAWYYHTRRVGVTLPDEPLATAYTIAQRYCLSHLVLDQNVTIAFVPLIEGQAEPPPFLTLLVHLDHGTPEDWSDDVRIYTFDNPC
ncbi:MAG: hypothetical protein HC915_19855 [Anaerolineae bacterium]|nr:hypothetical protein [Anaerolineae bacterium]